MLDVKRENKGRVSILSLSGVYYFESIHVVELEWSKSFAADFTVIAFDLSGIKFIDSSAIGSLVKYLNMARGKGIELVFIELSEAVKIVFETAKLDGFFRCMSRAEFESAFLS